jgi:hypothetical protein
VGFSFPGPLGSGRAILWQNKVPIDLNTLIPKDSPWYLLDAESINDAGQIVGYGTINGNVHAFIATPCDRDHQGRECGENVEGDSMGGMKSTKERAYCGRRMQAGFFNVPCASALRPCDRNSSLESASQGCR